jgi:hypothetical protein
LAEFAESGPTRALPALAADRRPETARRFLNLAVFLMLMRALFHEELEALSAEIRPHVARSVAFFLAACSCGGNAR